jgi:predicted ferric reductase
MSAILPGAFTAPLAGVSLGLHGYWYLGRATGFAAYGVLFVSVVFGLAVSSRLFDGLFARSWFFELHRFLSLFLVIAAGFHAVSMLPDPYAGFQLDELLVPFRSHLDRIATGIGVLTLYGLLLVSLSFYLTRWIGQKSWRVLHYLTFLLFAGATVHGIWAGTDSRELAVRFFYLVVGVMVIFLVFYRILAVRSARGLLSPTNADLLTARRPAAAVPLGTSTHLPGRIS